MRNGFLGAAALLVAATVAGAQTPTAGVSVPESAHALPPTYPGSQLIPDPADTNCITEPTVTWLCDECCAPPQRLWFSADYLLWWLKSQPAPVPVVTLASPADTAAATAFLNGTSATSVAAGAIGRPGTQVLFGGHNVGLNAFNGMRLGAGYWFGADARWGVEGSFFLLEQRANLFNVGSNAAGSPLLARPIYDTLTGTQISEAVSIPGFISGNSSVSTATRLSGWETNLAYNAVRNANFRVDLLAGFRSLNLNEGMMVQDNLNQLVPGFLTYLGTPIATGNTLHDYDSFLAANQFWGPQLGSRIDWYRGRFHINVLTKLAMGVTQQIVSINGGTTVLGPTGGVVAAAPGGILTNTANIGRYTRDRFTVVPEIGLNFGYRLTSHLEARCGYTFLYWSSVARPGNQMNHQVNTALVPSDPLFGSAGGGQHPAFGFVGSDFSAQGINLSLALTF